MSSAEECTALAGAASACAMPIVALLALMDVEFSASVLHGITRSLLLAGLGLVCLQGETRLFYTHHEMVQENFGFALKPLGRGVSYLMAGLYCVGARAASVAQATAAKETVSATFGFAWYICCLAMLFGSATSLWAWHGQRRAAYMDGDGGPDLDAYYISS
eukprot:TRINITY_DN48248_c0_g1_i1.p1 TRINITY_DN48248_c0_g1~~TRINITY_DN48248_c0_g1_i1.p1  ORF type:complete len:183 (+),score=24.69 TRINITY_DN48248_c0_g1_i1:69-551(+)